MATTKKNPEKLTGPEKVRFLSVLSKDPELQADVITQLRDMAVIPPAMKDRLADAAERLPAPLQGRVQEMLTTADEIAESTARYVRENHSVKAAKERLDAGVRRLRVR